MTAVITGVGAVSALGDGALALWDGLLAGRVAVGPIASFDASRFPVTVAAEVPAAIADRWPIELTGRDRKLGFALGAAQEAWRHAGCGPAETSATLSLALGLETALLGDFGFTLTADGERLDWASEHHWPSSEPRLRTPVDLPARALVRELGLSGPVHVHVSACAAGTMAVAHAAALVARGQAEVVLCGGADSMINPLGLGGMARLGAPSPRAAIDACRPFDRHRDGLVIGEGAAMFVVERADRARARGAPALATIAGWATTQDGYKATAPRPDGHAAAEAMRRALARAGLTGGDVGYLNAHGTGTPLGDSAEVLAIGSALAEAAPRVAISSIKGAIGHLMAAAGAIELAASLMVFARDQLPGTANLGELDPAFDLDIVGPAPVARAVEVVMSNSFGFGGQNSSIVVTHPERSAARAR